MHPYAKYSANKVASQTAKERIKGYDTGGNVKALPMTPGQAQSAIERLGKAGILDKEAATDFVASRSKAWGVDPLKMFGRAPKYARGGKVHSDAAQDKKLIKKMIRQEERKEGEKYARGGKVKKPSVEINILQGGGPPSSTSTPAALPAAPGPAPMLPMPGGGPMPPPMPPPGPPGPGMKRGGRVKMTGGAEGGLGRLQKAKNAKAARGG